MAEEDEAPADPLQLLRSGGALTVAPQAGRCVISEDQLDMLAAGGSDSSLQFSLALLGGAVGFSQNFFVVAQALHRGAPIEGLQAIFAAVFVACAVGAWMKFSEHRKVQTRVSTLVDRIRSGPKVNI